MPRKIKRYPQPPDPRKPSHLLLATKENGAGPWAYRLRDTGASGAFVRLQSGLVVRAPSSNPDTVFFLPDPLLPVGVTFALQCAPENHVPPYQSPGRRVWSILATSPVLNIYLGGTVVEDADLIADTISIDVEHQGTGTNEMPGPIVCTPIPWDEQEG